MSCEIIVMTSGAFTAAFLDLVPDYERRTGNKVVVATTTMGSGATSIPSRLARGEPVDVVIVSDAALKKLIDEGRVAAESHVPLARSSIAMAVRAGAPRPDIGSVEALKQALLNARSIAYSASVSGDYLSTELFQRLGLAERILPKCRRIEGERVGAVVGRGEAEIGFQQMSELLPERGIDIVGPLPAEVQKVSVFAGGVAAASKHPNEAYDLIKFLGSADAARAVTKSGLEPFRP
jgi:molybdate transport system substrate-binding protein